jgi:hypothetical protein
MFGGTDEGRHNLYWRVWACVTVVVDTVRMPKHAVVGYLSRIIFYDLCFYCILSSEFFGFCSECQNVHCVIQNTCYIHTHSSITDAVRSQSVTLTLNNTHKKGRLK